MGSFFRRGEQPGQSSSFGSWSILVREMCVLMSRSSVPYYCIRPITSRSHAYLAAGEQKRGQNYFRTVNACVGRIHGWKPWVEKKKSLAGQGDPTHDKRPALTGRSEPGGWGRIGSRGRCSNSHGCDRVGSGCSEVSKSHGCDRVGSGYEISRVGPGRVRRSLN